MKKIYFRFNLIGLICILAGIAFVVFNIPLYTWLIIFGIGLIITGVLLCR